MKLYIKQKVFSWADRFCVRDETGADRYYVEGEIFTWGKKLHVYDMQDAEIVKRFTFMRPSYYVEGPNWEVEGRFLYHEYEITKGGASLATIHKEWMAWGDSYEIDIADTEDERLALAVVLAIDCAIDSDEA